MPVLVDEATRAKWNRALTNIYFHARKNLYPDVFTGASLPGDNWTLTHAVDVLAEEPEPQVLPCVRLGLAEMVRNRKHFSTPDLVVWQIAKLVLQFARLTTAGLPPPSMPPPPGGPFPPIVNSFLALGSDDAPQSLFIAALKLMQSIHPNQRFVGTSNYSCERKTPG
jgi:hypothetical protein